MLYIRVAVGCGRGLWQRWDDTNATLAFEDGQVIPPFSREETDDTDDIDDTDDTDDTDYSYNTEDTEDTKWTGLHWNRLE